ncbi:hypothetical protein WJX77_006006 [Trebouxia sp. C0004]
MLSRVIRRDSASQPGSRKAGCSTPTNSHGEWQALHLQVLPDQQDPGHKHIIALGQVAHFHLHKFTMPTSGNQYRWKLSDQRQACTEGFTVSFGGTGDTVNLQGKNGELVAAVDLCRSAYYTVIEFEWKAKSYRWRMTWADASNSPTQLRIELVDASTKQCLACISGSGCQRKKFWVQQPEPDVISVADTDDRAWLQLIVATAMIAAKTQRHRGKVTTAARRSG